MPRVNDPPPAVVSQEIAALRAALARTIPAKRVDDNLLIATWNLKAFGGLTDLWTAGEVHSPKRDLRALRYIGEIIARFDVIAIQEVVGNLRALRHLLKLLNRDGDDWSFLMTDVSRGSAGNNERMAFVFDARRVRLSGLASELVVPPEWNVPDRVLRQQFARTPYAVGFRAGRETFVLTTLHVDYNARPGGRAEELAGIADWMDDWAQRESSWDHNLVVLGDFNIDRHGDELWQAFTSRGLTVPDDLHAVPRSIFDEPGDPRLRFYDQIAWFSARDRRRPALSLEFRTAGGFDFVPYVYRETGLSRAAIQWRVSDHLPLWAEFGRRPRL
jgi:endonuclease/exonuclease/phosphatase family metal-dependent hydrolase